MRMLERFVRDICQCEALWTPAKIIDDAVERIRQQVGDDKVILGLSGGGYGGVNATGQAENDFVIANLLTDTLNGVVDDFSRGPQGFTLADIAHKALPTPLSVSVSRLAMTKSFSACPVALTPP